MSDTSPLPSRFTWIDDTNRGDHYYLASDDRCIFFGDWKARKGFEGPTNQLIVNFKHKPSVARQKPAIAGHKNRAIRIIAGGLRGAISQPSIESATWVPIPTSKVPGHPDYDDRLTQALAQGFAGYDADIRPLLRQTESTEADHTSGGARLSPEVLLSILEVDPAQVRLAPIRQNGIVLFDDVLTSGKHFRCCQQLLRQAIPGVPVLGVFVARCIHPDPFAAFKNPDDVAF